MLLFSSYLDASLPPSFSILAKDCEKDSQDDLKTILVEKLPLLLLSLKIIIIVVAAGTVRAMTIKILK